MSDTSLLLAEMHNLLSNAARDGDFLNLSYSNLEMKKGVYNKALANLKLLLPRMVSEAPTSITEYTVGFDGGSYYLSGTCFVRRYVPCETLFNISETTAVALVSINAAQGVRPLVN